MMTSKTYIQILRGGKIDGDVIILVCIIERMIIFYLKNINLDLSWFDLYGAITFEFYGN